MADKTFRFGVVGAPQGGVAAWRGLAVRTEQLGFSTLLAPDNLTFPAPTVSLAIAASATKDLHVGTFVLASPLRTPRAAAWDANSLSTMTDGRFELGLGTGLPVMKQQAEELGLPYESPAGRLRQIAETVDHVRKLDGDRHTPVLIAAGGPKARALAGEKADIVALAGGAFVTREETGQALAQVRTAAGSRADDIEYSMNIFVAGDGEMPEWVKGFVGADRETLIERDSLAILPGDATAMADELLRRRDAFGTTYVTVNAMFMDVFAPVVELLAGK
jgi:probable F420-dependent oxidoreductase